MPSKHVHIQRVSDETVLYHYTKSGGINGILNNNCFWATKSDFLNDPKEFSYFYEIMKEEFLLMIKKKEWADMLLHDVMEENVITTGADREFFVLSFSCIRDSITLWSEFGSKTGYNIGFGSREIIKRIEENNKIDYHGLVVYNTQDQRKLIKKLISDITTDILKMDLKDILAMGYSNRGNENYRKIVRRFQKVTAVYAMFFKNEAFAQEKEYRFVFKRDGAQKVHFREKDGFLIPYMEIPLEKSKLPIKEIVVAPQNHIDLAKNGLDYLLKYKGYEAPVSLSNIKLRY